MHKLFTAFICILSSVLVFSTEFESKKMSREKFNELYQLWMKSIEKERSDFKSKTSFSSMEVNIFTREYFDILNRGPINVGIIIELYKQDTRNKYLPSLFVGIVKLHFQDSFDRINKKIVLTDYGYSYTSIFRLKSNEPFNSPYLYWWDKGRKLTPKIFEKKYSEYIKINKNSGAKSIKEKYIALQNMGIIILPNLLKKIEKGDYSLIPIFNYLSNQKLKTVNDCRKWWKINKDQYRDILHY